MGWHSSAKSSQLRSVDNMLQAAALISHARVRFE